MNIVFRDKEGRTAHLEVDRLNPYVLTGGSPDRVRKVADFLDHSSLFVGKRGHVVVNGLYRNIRVSAVSTGMGPASAMIILPEVIESIRDESMVMLRLGTSGSLQPYVKKGDIHIPTSCIRDEGSTSAVVGPEYPATASPELLPILVKAAEMAGYKYGVNLWVGPVHTKDDLYFRERPTFSPKRVELRERLNSYIEMGALSSEMEFSTYCILRDYYERRTRKKILVGCVLMVVTDYSEEEPVEFSGIDTEHVDRKLIEIGLRAIELFDDLRNGKPVGLDSIILRLTSKARP